MQPLTRVNTGPFSDVRQLRQQLASSAASNRDERLRVPQYAKPFVVRSQVPTIAKSDRESSCQGVATRLFQTLTKPFSGFFGSSKQDAAQSVKNEEVIATFDEQREENFQQRDDMSMASNSVLVKRSAMQRQESEMSLTQS